MDQEDNDIIIVTDEEAGERLDKILANRFRDENSRSGVNSRTYFQYLIEEQRVLLNGLPIKKRVQPKAGDEVEINFICTPELNMSPENIPLDIIFEDNDIIVVNKPVGLVVHPAAGNWSGTFVNALLFHCRNLQEMIKNGDPASCRPGIVHRLDKDTSGLLLAAKNPLAQQRLIAMFASREVHKEYLAICLGNPGNVDIDKPIGRHPKNRKLMAIKEEGGRSALSICRTLSCNGKISLVNVILATGRTHQIRVHLKHQGTPILGDSTYGNTQANGQYNAMRQMLHAYLLRFKHPITGKEMELKAPVPEDMARIILTSKLNVEGV